MDGLYFGYTYMHTYIYTYIYIHIYYIYILYIYYIYITYIYYIYIYIRRLTLQLFLTIVLQDTLKSNMNFQKLIELNNKKCLQQVSQKDFLSQLFRNHLS